MSATAPIERTTGMSKVHNNSDKEYREMFKGKEVVIPARGFVEMDHYEAVEFVGQWKPFVKTERGDIIKSKPLKLERCFDPGKIFDPKGLYKSHADGKTFASQAELDEHMKANAGKFTPQRDEMLDQQLKTSSKTTEVLGSLAEALIKLNDKLDRVEKRGMKKKDDTQ